MNYNKHFELRDKHAFLGASKYHWLNYDTDKLTQTYLRAQAVLRGTELHAFAAKCIELKQKLPKSKKTLNNFVNDAIGFRMVSEQILYYSENCFGTADAISDLNSVLKTKVLRIHDLKTGDIPAHMEQLEIYAALFCLEYHMKPSELADIELRIYQSGEIIAHHPSSEDIDQIINKIISFDKVIKRLKIEEDL